MNKNHFAIIYSETRGKWVVVRESASAKGAPRYCGAISMLLGQLLALSALHLTPLQAQVAADPNAPAAHRPVIDTTANGRTLVQITNPSAAGVSKNLYTQFNVDPQGVILNNARTVALTQQGGWVAANPALAASARVILNQVTGTSPTSIRGYLEVAGQRADVVVANPNGITCNGGGFINTSRGVLTTGMPVIGAGGNLEAFRTTSGRIQIGEAGFDGTSLDQLDLIARSVEVNGQLWSGQRLNVIAGAHQVDYASLGVQTLQGEGGQPTVGIDVAQLGGMYAGKIHLVGTEAGVGVHSKGVLAAQAGDFTLSAEGRIVLEGSTVSATGMNLSTREGLQNRGTLHACGSVNLAAQGAVANTGSLSSGGDLTATAAAITSTGSMGAGIDMDGLATRSGSLHLTASGTLVLDNAIARDDLELTAGHLDLAHATLTAGGSAQLTASGNIDHRGGDLQANGALTISAEGTWDNREGKVLAGGSASIAANRIDNWNGLLGAATDLNLRTETSLDNTGGTLYATRDLGTQGTLSAITNVGGQIASARDLALEARTLTGDGLVAAGRNASMVLNENLTQAEGGRIAAEGTLSLDVAGTLSNAGDLEATTLEIRAGSLENQPTGLLNASLVDLRSQDQIINAGRVFGDAIAIQSSGSFNNQNRGVVASRGSLDIGALNVVNQEQSWLYADGDIALGGALDEARRATGSAQGLYNSSSLIQSETGNIFIAAANVDNRNDGLRIEQRETERTNFVRITPKDSPVSYDASELTPTTGLDGIGSCYRLPDGSLIMHYTRTDGTRTVTNAFVTESAPARILAGGDIRIDSDVCVNSDSQIIAGGDLEVIAPSNDGDVNRGTMGYEITSEIGTARYTWTEWHGTKDGRSRYWSDAAPHAPAPLYDPRPLGLAVMLDHAAPGSSANPAAGQALGALNLPAVPSALLASLSANGPVQTVGNSGSPIPNLALPGSRLYQLRTAPGSTYLVETDPRFTNHRTFMGSEYMLSRLPRKALATRLGDGFFETQLVSRQIETLTGRKFLQGHTNAFTEFQALMDSGLTVAESFQLEPGVALSEAQMAALTSDIVWLVKQSVALPDGTRQDVLVPVVYLARVHAQDIQPTGALLSGENLSLFTQHTLENTGTLLASNRLTLSAQDITNRGRLQTGGDLLLDAGRNVLSQGQLSGARVAILAGNDATLQSAARRTTGATGSATQLEQLATVTADQLDIRAGRDITLEGAQLDVKGDAALAAGRNLDVKAVTTATEEHLVWNAKNRRAQSQETAVGSQVNTGGNLTLAAGQDVTTEAATLTADQALRIQAAGDVTLGTAQEVSSFEEAHYRKSKGTFSTTKSTSLTTRDQATQVGTTVSGNTVAIQSGQDLALTGSSVAGTGDVTLAAGGSLSIEAATNTQASTRYSRTSRSGLMSGGSFGFTIGKREQTDRLAQEGATQSASRSLVGSTDGNLTLTAGTEARVSGSDLVAAKDLAITAPSITIDPGLDRTRTQERHDVKQSGLTVAVSSPVLAAAQTLRAMNTAARESQDPRVRALAAATAGLATKNAYDAVASNPKSAGGVTVSATIGQSRSHSESRTDTTTAAGSLLKAGGDVTLTATERDLTVVGSTIQAGKDADLKAAGNLNLLASQDTARTQGHNSGSSWGVGVAATYGSGGWAAGITANASASKGRSNGSDVTHTATKVIAGNTAALASGQDTTLKGATVTAQQITANVGGDLAIESPQDTSTYRSQDQSLGGSVTFGIGFAASANASRQRINGDHASVTEQSGIQAGDGGFQVTVKGNTDLKGAVIASTEKAVAEGRNTLTTGSLTQSDLENRSEYEATSVGVGVSASRSGSGSSKNVQSFQDKTGASLPTAMSASGEDQSTTRSGLSGATVTITDEAKRAASEQALAGFDRTATTGQDRANALAKTFDQDEIRRAFEVTQAFGQEVGTFLANKAAKLDAINQALKEETAKENTQSADRILELQREREDLATWAPGGTSRQLLTALSAAASGNVTGTSAQLIQNAFVSLLQQKGAAYLGTLVKNGQLQEGSPEHAALHAIVAAAGSAASGQDMLSGSAGAVASSLLTNLFDNQSLGQTETEKEAHRNLLLTLVAGLSEGTGLDTPSAIASAQAALDNNANLSLMNLPRLDMTGLAQNRGDGKAAGTLKAWLDTAPLKRLVGNDPEALRALEGHLDLLIAFLAKQEAAGNDLRPLTIEQLDAVFLAGYGNNAWSNQGLQAIGQGLVATAGKKGQGLVVGTYHSLVNYQKAMLNPWGALQQDIAKGRQLYDEALGLYANIQAEGGMFPSIGAAYDQALSNYSDADTRGKTEALASPLFDVALILAPFAKTPVPALESQTGAWKSASGMSPNPTQWEMFVEKSVANFADDSGFIVFRRFDQQAFELLASQPGKYVAKSMAEKVKTNGLYIVADGSEAVNKLVEQKGVYGTVRLSDGTTVVTKGKRIIVSDPDPAYIGKLEPTGHPFTHHPELGVISDFQKATIESLNTKTGVQAIQHGPQSNIFEPFKIGDFPMTAVSKEGKVLIHNQVELDAFLMKMKQQGLSH